MSGSLSLSLLRSVAYCGCIIAAAASWHGSISIANLFLKVCNSTMEDKCFGLEGGVCTRNVHPSEKKKYTRKCSTKATGTQYGESLHFKYRSV